VPRFSEGARIHSSTSPALANAAAVADFVQMNEFVGWIRYCAVVAAKQLAQQVATACKGIVSADGNYRGLSIVRFL
jgi:hypothetical protein